MVKHIYDNKNYPKVVMPEQPVRKILKGQNE